MIQLAILGSDSSHAETFVALVHDRRGPFWRDYQVVSLWGLNGDEARRKARETGIARVAETPDEALDGVDAALVLGRFAEDHIVPAQCALARHLPTYVDKLLTHEPASAGALVSLAEQQNVALASFSPYRFSRGLRAFAEEVRTTWDDSGTLVSYGPMDCNDLQGDARLQELYFYAIHSMEMVFTVLGCDPARLQYLAGPDRCSAVMQFSEGVECSLHFVKGLPAEDYRLTWFSRSATRHFAVDHHDADLYRSAFSGICAELFEVKGTRTAHSSLRAIEVLTALRSAVAV